MIFRTPVRLLFCLFIVCALAPAVFAQDEVQDTVNRCETPRDIDEWLNCRVDEISAANVQQRDPGKRVELPSIADSSTSLVDRSEAPDVLGIALNLAGLSAGDEGQEKDSVSFTTTAYALYAGFTQRDPLNPALYVRHPNLRRFSFTFGQQTPEGEEDGQRATIIGTKILLINKRDASLGRNRARLRAVSDRLKAATGDFGRIRRDVENYIYSQLAARLNLPATPTNVSIEAFNEEHLSESRIAATLGMLNEEQLAEITNLITNRIESRVLLDMDTRRVAEEIRRAPQLAFIFQSKLREGDGTDEYRTGLAFDYGIYRRINLTINGTFDYNDSKTVGGDTRGARFAGETHFQLTPDRRVLEGAGPWMFSVAGEAKWMSNSDATYTGQLKLTIPVMDGVDFPLSVSFANRRDLINESHVRGRFGFSFDLPKLLRAAKR
jgi:hypothetical protein